MSLPESYHKLIVYQKSRELILQTYLLTKLYPKSEEYVLVPQMRRAAISIDANIVEGYSKHSTKELRRFLNISISSATELEFFINLSLDLNYITEKNHKSITNLLIEVKKLLYSFRRALKTKV